jgi:hypothetical protein
VKDVDVSDPPISLLAAQLDHSVLAGEGRPRLTRGVSLV